MKTKIKIIALAAAISVFPQVDITVKAASSFSDTKGHWAEASILEAANGGYISGYPDGTFLPNKELTRAEFIKMIIVALHLPEGETRQADPWYVPFIESAKSAGIYVESDFDSKNWTNKITRQEMVYLAVRAIGEKGRDGAEFMYLAAKKGLISGIGSGKLESNGTTTRAQAVTIMKRIQQVKAGISLPVDQMAIANAEKAMKAKKDAWGRVIRTTNLPENYKEYPYILEEIPNEMYEMEHKNVIGSSLTPAEFADDKRVTKEIVDNWVDIATRFGKLSLNVDYKTIDSNWMKEYTSTLLSQTDKTKSSISKYINWVKENHIQIEGKFVAEPSMLAIKNGNIVVRSQFEFNIKNYDTNEKLFNDMWFPNHKYKKNTWYRGYTDIELGSNVFNGSFGFAKIVDNASIFRVSLIKKANE